MKIKTLLIIQKLLNNYKDTIREDKINTVISKDWRFYFSRAELIEILEFKYGDNLHTKINLTNATSIDILNFIEDEFYVLGYVLKKWNFNFQSMNQISLNREIVDSVLNQLQLDFHYLREKPINKFDSYDISNFTNLCYKAGLVKKVYGIFDSEINEADIPIITSPPKVQYDSENEAMNELSRMINEKECEKGERKVLSDSAIIPHF